MKKWTIGFLIAVAVMGYKLGAVGYLETSEARYAEISREMVESGDYVTPRLTYIKHFHKPPLTYWVTAASFKLFGVNDLSGRLFLVVASLGVLVFTGLGAKLLFPDADKVPLWSVLILFSSPLFLAQSRTLTTDIYLTLFTLGTIYFHWRWIFLGNRPTDVLISAIFLGLAYLTKGPVVLLFFPLPWLVYWAFHRKAHPLRVLPLLVWIGVPLLVAAPWFYKVIQNNPGLLDYFLKRQTVDRVATTVYRRSGPPYYYLGVLFGGMLFWFTFYLAGLFRTLKGWKGNRPSEPMLLLWAYSLVPLIFFSINQSKLPPYLLPAMPWMAVLVAHGLSQTKRLDCRPALEHGVNGVLLLLLLGLFSALPFAQDRLHVHIPLIYWIVVVLLCLGALGWGLTGFLHRRGMLPWVFALVNVALFLWGMSVLPLIQEAANSFEPMARRIQAHAQDQGATDYRIIAYKDRLPSLTFYTGKRLIQIPHDRETQFESPDDVSWHSFLSQDTADISRLMADSTQTFLVIRRGRWGKLQKAFSDLAGLRPLVQDGSGSYVLLCNR